MHREPAGGPARQGRLRMRPNPNCRDNMRLLFVTSTRIGDAVLSSGLLDCLITRHPGLRVTVAAGRVAAPLFEGVPGLERLIRIEKRRHGMHWLDLWRTVAGRRWDIVVDLRASALAYLLRAGRRHVMRPSRAPHHRIHDLANVLNLDHPPAPTLWTRPEHEAAAQRLVGSDLRPILAVGPTANWIGKQWPVARFRELVQRADDARRTPGRGAGCGLWGAARACRGRTVVVSGGERRPDRSGRQRASADQLRHPQARGALCRQ